MIKNVSFNSLISYQECVALTVHHNSAAVTDSDVYPSSFSYTNSTGHSHGSDWSWTGFTVYSCKRWKDGEVDG